MNLDTRRLTPPPGTMFLEGVEVTGFTRLPDHSGYYVSRKGASTQIVRSHCLDNAIEVR